MPADTAGLENLFFQSSSKYSVLEEIGRGGMGIVFRAQKNTGGVIDNVVLKSLRTIRPDEEEKLRQEASIATMLRNENIVKTYGLESVPFGKLPADFLSMLELQPEEKAAKKVKGDQKYLLFLVMDYIKGTDFYNLLTQHLKKDLLFPAPLAAFVIGRIASALSYAHTYIIHRDISPENVLISDQGVCKLTDFGIAVVSHQQPEDWAGKLMYMAPEQLRNNPIDERADIFALGLVAFQAVTGIPLLFAPFSLPFEDQVRMIYAQMEGNLLPPHMVRSDVPIELSRIIAKMLSFAPEYRYQRAATVVTELEKEYLYARGYGPTYNSLAAYIDIFKSDFQEYNEDQLQQLSFLKDANGQISLRRPLTIEGYTKAGQRLLAERKGTLVVERLRDLYKKKQAAPAHPKVQKMPVVKAQYLGNVVENFPLRDNTITIGRATDNIVVLPHKIVSGHHAKFYLKDGAPIVEDIGSQNGIFLNNAKVSKAYLQEGDKVQIGKTLFYFLWEKEPTNAEQMALFNDEFMPQIMHATDISVQFYPAEAVFVQLMGAIEQILLEAKVGELKRSLIPMAFYEVIQILGSKNTSSAMQLRIMRASRHMSFYCKAAQQSSGYDSFFYAMFQRMTKELAEEDQFDAEEMAISLILKAFDRIEMSRSRKEIGLFISYV
jgi:serine/threonine protein kinase